MKIGAVMQGKPAALFFKRLGASEDELSGGAVA